VVAADDLLWLTASRWLMPVLALTSRESGARFAVMARQLGASRSMLGRTIPQLEEKGWLAPNPGHGHPLRPEYVLTETGRSIGAWCERVMDERERLGLQPDQLTRWSLPLLSRLGGGWARFSTLEADLRPISPRALSLTLKQALATGLIERRLEDAFPPMPLYGLTSRGESLAHALR
jgi:DNA-binding HxlR family transcriptional regulator